MQGITHIGFDLDGTLLNSQKHISEFTRNVLEKVHNRGFRYVVLSGRHADETMELLRQEQVLHLMDWIVTADGCHIYDNVNDRTIEMPTLKPRDAYRIIKIVCHADTIDYVTPYGDVLLFTSSKLRTLKRIVRHIHRNVSHLFHGISQAEKMIVIEPLSKEKEAALRENYCVHAFDGDRYEILHSKTNKYAALYELHRRGLVDLSAFVYFGDDNNDIECFTQLKNVCVMGQAQNANKQYSCMDILTNDEDGVANALLKIAE